MTWVNVPHEDRRDHPAVEERTIHYKSEDGISLIEISLESVDQLFNSLDPAPFRQKDLDKQAEDYIVGAIEDFPVRAPLKIVFHLPQSVLNSSASGAIPDALHHYFAYSLESERRKLRSEMRETPVSLAIGLSFLFACMALRQLIIAWDAGTLGHIAAEGLLIAGWVAMWRPLDTFLYGWWPIRRRCGVYGKLTTIPVETRETSVGGTS